MFTEFSQLTDVQGSVMGPLQYVSMYAIEMIKKLQTEFIASLSPKQSVTDAFNAHCQEWVKHTVWVEECRSWYIPFLSHKILPLSLTPSSTGTRTMKPAASTRSGPAPRSTTLK